MKGLRLRTKFLISMLLVIAGLTWTTLLVVQKQVSDHTRLEAEAGLRNAVVAFENSRRQREQTLERSAQLLADLPSLRALMTTHHAPTIQDGSRRLWQISGSDFFALVDRSGKVLAFHATHSTAEPWTPSVPASDLAPAGPPHWQVVGGRLYETFTQPIFFGPSEEGKSLGFAVVGYEIDSRMARDLASVAASEVAFRDSGTILASTLTPEQQANLQKAWSASNTGRPTQPNTSSELLLDRERFLETTLDLEPGSASGAQLIVLKSLQPAQLFLASLNRLVLGLGLAAMLAGSALVFFLSYTFTRPLNRLVSGVRALGQGDYDYPLELRTKDEVAEVTEAFRRVRSTLRDTQADLLDAERLATIGRMASSISHDLRHWLAAIVANSEFLLEPGLTSIQREELYGEIQTAVSQMNELIESLLEFSRTRESLRPSYGDLRATLQRAVDLVRKHPEHHSVPIEVAASSALMGWFDGKKLERAFYNLLINACEAAPISGGRVTVRIAVRQERFEVKIEDNGAGIPIAIHDSLFQPFVSQGKENGTGMGLTVVQKIIVDHGGEVWVERSSATGSVFAVRLPLGVPVHPVSSDLKKV